MNEHTGFHDREHFGPECLACLARDVEDKKKALEKALRLLRRRVEYEQDTKIK